MKTSGSIALIKWIIQLKKGKKKSFWFSTKRVCIYQKDTSGKAWRSLFWLQENWSCVPQGNVLNQSFILHTFVNTIFKGNIVTLFSDDTTIMVTSKHNNESPVKFRSAIKKLKCKTKKWQIKLNLTKLVYNDFINKRIEIKLVFVNERVLLYGNTTKHI